MKHIDWQTSATHTRTKPEAPAPTSRPLVKDEGVTPQPKQTPGTPLTSGYNAAKNVVHQVTSTAKQLGEHAINEVEHLQHDSLPVTDKTLDQINADNRKFWEHK